MNWSQRVQFAKIRVCAKIWQVTNDNGGESCFFFTRPQSPWDMFHMCWIPSAHTSVTWPPCLKAALHARSQYGAHSWWGAALLSSFILILQKLMPYGSVFSPTTERKAVLQLKILIISSKYSRTNETGKGTGKLKKTTRINEKWPPLDITLQSDSYRKFPQEKALPNVSLQQQQPVPLGSQGREWHAREPLFVITSMKYSEQIIHWSSFSSTSFMWLRTSSFCACTFSFSSCKDTTNPTRHSGGPMRMQNRTGSRANHLE